MPMEPKALEKLKNKTKATLEARTSPVSKDQSTVPIADALRDYWKRGMLTFSIPAHNGGRGVAPEFTKWLGEDAARMDLPMSHGVDTRDRSWKVQSTAQELFADAVGAKQTLFSTNGSSMSMHVALMAVVGPGEQIVMARNGHKSTFAGLILSGAHPVYVEPYYDEDLQIALGPLPEEFERILEMHPKAKAGLVFTPSYYGTSADVRALAAACHARDLPLVTDDAWGLDYALSGHPDLPEGALAQGSDLAIGSVHKTLTGLTQTSVLSVGSDRIETERLQLCFELEESTSASAVLLSSIDGARAQFVREGEQLLDRAVKSARLMRERIAAEVPELTVVDGERLGAIPGVTAVDTTHVMIETASIGLSGYTADDWLRNERQLDVELVDHRRIMPLVTFAHGEEEVDRFVRALRDLVDEHVDEDDNVAELPTAPQIRTEQAMSPREAFFAKTEDVKPSEAVGRVSAEWVTPYPPGIPAVAAGGFVEGTADPALSKLRVVT